MFDGYSWELAEMVREKAKQMRATPNFVCLSPKHIRELGIREPDKYTLCGMRILVDESLGNEVRLLYFPLWQEW